ncbi:hypothetical protein BGZ72_007781 [Mortierella alpina]|nr:hypothetical protein BGZ72_007781 [Mortierella alpina]
MDMKKIDPALPSWDAQTEQDIFGNQAPYATGSYTPAPSTDTDESTQPIYQAHPYRPNATHYSLSSPTHPDLAGLPPKYSQDPNAVPTAPSLESQPQQQTSQETTEVASQSQHSPYSHQQQQQQQPIQPFTPLSNHTRNRPTSFSPLYTHRYSPVNSQESPSYYGSVPPERHREPFSTKALFSIRALLCRRNRYIIGGILLLLMIIFFLSHAVVSFVDPCSLTSDSSMHSHSEAYFSDATEDIFISLLDLIPGNVVIREAEDWDAETIEIYFYMKSTSIKVLDDMSFKSETDTSESDTSPFIRIFSFLRTEGAEEKKKLLRGHCAKIDVELVYPKAGSNPPLLMVEGVVGDVHVQLGSHTTILDRIRLDVTNGNILIDGVSIRKEASFRVGTGKLQGTMRAIGEVNMETTAGDIDIVLHPSLLFLDSGSENLNVTMKSMEGSVNLAMVR